MITEEQIVSKYITKIAKLNKRKIQRAFDKLPARAKCPNCGKVRSKKAFGMRVLKRDKNGIPVQIARQSYCGDCR